jgi:hypothetical protein
LRARTLILVAALLCLAPSARADEASDFEKARIAYVKKDYVESAARFEAMLDPQTGTLKTKELVHEATFCFGAVRFAQGKMDDAHALWKKVIIDTAGQFAPDPLQYPTTVLNDFINEKTTLNNEIRQQEALQLQQEKARREHDAQEKARLTARVKELERLASTETVIVPHSRLVALLPFGIGQFQNGKNALGWLFLVTEGVATLTTFVLFAPYRYNLDQYYSVLSDPTPDESGHRIDTANKYSVVAQDIRTADFILLGALGAIALAGIIEAQVDFVPELRLERPRKLPARTWSVLPSFSPLPGAGAQIGLLGRF